VFTGLIEDLGTVRELQKGADGVRLSVTTHIPTAELSLGESIAVNGICLTAVEFGAGAFAADVSRETLGRTNLGNLAVGDPVNLERALRLSDRLGGHLVSGHVDGTAVLESRQREGNALRFTFRFPPDLGRYLVEKGSVALDGISLTIADTAEETFSVAVIPHTLERTTLHRLKEGARVNLETDILGKYVERLLRGGGAGNETRPIDLEFLAKHGFL
jgi:riboflavin synthase